MTETPAAGRCPFTINRFGCQRLRGEDFNFTMPMCDLVLKIAFMADFRTRLNVMAMNRHYYRQLLPHCYVHLVLTQSYQYRLFETACARIANGEDENIFRYVTRLRFRLADPSGMQYESRTPSPISHHGTQDGQSTSGSGDANRMPGPGVPYAGSDGRFSEAGPEEWENDAVPSEQSARTSASIEDIEVIAGNSSSRLPSIPEVLPFWSSLDRRDNYDTGASAFPFSIIQQGPRQSFSTVAWDANVEPTSHLTSMTAAAQLDVPPQLALAPDDMPVADDGQPPAADAWDEDRDLASISRDSEPDILGNIAELRALALALSRLQTIEKVDPLKRRGSKGSMKAASRLRRRLVLFPELKELVITPFDYPGQSLLIEGVFDEIFPQVQHLKLEFQLSEALCFTWSTNIHETYSWAQNISRLSLVFSNESFFQLAYMDEILELPAWPGLRTVEIYLDAVDYWPRVDGQSWYAGMVIEGPFWTLCFTEGLVENCMRQYRRWHRPFLTSESWATASNCGRRMIPPINEVVFHLPWEPNVDWNPTDELMRADAR